jgi:hypothetical protein
MITRLCLTRARSQCDGDRPACFHCRSQSITCVYRGNAAFPLQTNKLVFEVVQLLGAMPQDEASRVLRVLRGEHDASVILSVLRGGMDSKQRPSDLSNAAAIMDDSFQSVELATNFPVAYPRLPLIRVEALRAGRYDNLTKPIADQRIESGPGTPQDEASSEDKPPGAPLCDARLSKINIAQWTSVPISNHVAAQAISLYLQTDHPLMGHFNPHLFLSGLLSQNPEHCTSLLVNALLFWACVGKLLSLTSLG